jgi:penicillin-binding protein 1A
LAAGYAVFANSGYQVKPYLITKITDSDGKVIESVDPAKHISAYRVIDQRNAFLMTSMMQDVINRGTARQASVLGRSDIAGKTGTTNDQRDVWFAGFNPKEVAVAWMGYDSPKSLGRDETGGKAALPIWIKYMEVALKNMPVYQYKVPQGVVKLKIDPEDGTLLNDFSFKDGIDEYFYHENPPPSASYDIPSLEDTTESDYSRSDSMDMITNPLRGEVKKLPPVEERKLEPQTKPETPTREQNTGSQNKGNPASRLFN